MLLVVLFFLILPSFLAYLINFFHSSYHIGVKAGWGLGWSLLGKDKVCGGGGNDERGKDDVDICLRPTSAANFKEPSDTESCWLERSSALLLVPEDVVVLCVFVLLADIDLSSISSKSRSSNSQSKTSPKDLKDKK